MVNRKYKKSCNNITINGIRYAILCTYMNKKSKKTLLVHSKGKDKRWDPSKLVDIKELFVCA